MNKCPFTLVFLLILTWLSCFTLHAADNEGNSPTLTAEEIEAFKTEEEQERQKMLVQVQADLDASSQNRRVRTYRAKVIDQDGKPVAGRPIHYLSLNQRADFLVSGIAWTTTEGEILTDENGVAVFKPDPFRNFQAAVSLRHGNLKDHFRMPYDRKTPACTRYYENIDAIHPLEPDKQGFNMVFEVYRYRGPEPLVDVWSGETVPNDGAWRAVSMLGANADGKEIDLATAWVGPRDFELTVSRPHVPLQEDAPGTLPNSPPRRVWIYPPYTMTLRCLSGGIQMAAPSPAIEAPIEGYVREISWQFSTPQPGINSSSEDYAGPSSIFWRRDETPVRYIKLRLEVEWKLDKRSREDPKPIVAELSWRLLVNLQGGRLFERSDGAGGPEAEPWVKRFTDAEIRALGARPVDPTRFPPADAVLFIKP